MLLARGADANITTKVIDVAKFNALDRAAAGRQRKVLEGSSARSEKPPTPSQVQAAIEAGRECSCAPARFRRPIRTRRDPPRRTSIRKRSIRRCRPRAA